MAAESHENAAWSEQQRAKEAEYVHLFGSWKETDEAVLAPMRRRVDMPTTTGTEKMEDLLQISGNVRFTDVKAMSHQMAVVGSDGQRTESWKWSRSHWSGRCTGIQRRKR